MKSTIISIALFLIILPTGISQTVIREGLYFNPAGRQVWVSKIGGEKLDRALLWKVSKDSIFIIESSSKTISPTDSFPPKPERIYFGEIESLTTLKNRPGITGLWLGAIAGFVTGVIINSATYQEVESTWQILDEGETSLLSGLFGALAGAGGGAAIASVAKKKWEINGNKNKYDDIIFQLDKRSYLNRSTRPKKTGDSNPFLP